MGKAERGADRARAYLSGDSHGAGNEQVGRGDARGHHAELGRLDEVGEILDLLGHTGLVLVLLLVAVGGAVSVSCLLRGEGVVARRGGAYGSVAMFAALVRWMKRRWL